GEVVGGEIVAIEVPILRRGRHELLAVYGLMQDRLAGHVKVMPVLFHDLRNVLEVARLGVEYHDRVGIQIYALARPRGEVGRRIASRDIQQPIFNVERVRGPGSGAAYGYAWRVVPGRPVQRRLAQRAADRVAFNL